MASGAQKQRLAVGVRRQQRAVARKGQPQNFRQAVHRIGRKHAGAGTAGGAGQTFDLGDICVGNRFIGCFNHGVNQIGTHDLIVAQLKLTRLHRPAGDENSRNIQAHRRHQHPRRNLVAIGDADHRVGAMAVDHVFDRIGDQITRRQ